MAHEFIPYQATLTLGDEEASYVLLEALELEMERLLEEDRHTVPQERESVARFISAGSFLLVELRKAWSTSGNVSTEEDSEFLKDSIRLNTRAVR
ncbi:hypothetical protein NHF46_12855 [Arthrobacter alpinus]|nr:hypothetical protein [Arthrobacter alpinus]